VRKAKRAEKKIQIVKRDKLTNTDAELKLTA
jgi:hypothetical protein